MKKERKRLIAAILIWLAMGMIFYIMSQDFTVTSVREMPFDLTNRMDSAVKDRNGNVCALLKVVAPKEFEFSGPYSPVKRTDKPGEIWLYFPPKTKTITISHPRWGVLRDYRLETPLEEKMTYEMRIKCPQVEVKLKHDTITLTKTRTDTMVVERKRERMPLRTHIMLTMSGHRKGPSEGVMIALMRRHGAWLHARSNFVKCDKLAGTCDTDGRIEGTGEIPYYTGKTRRSMYTLTAGAIHHLWHGLRLYEGMGYGFQKTAWQLAPSYGSRYMKLKDESGCKVAAELGLAYSYKRLSVLASATWVKNRDWQGTFGIGINL